MKYPYCVLYMLVLFFLHADTFYSFHYIHFILFTVLRPVTLNLLHSPSPIETGYFMYINKRDFMLGIKCALLISPPELHVTVYSVIYLCIVLALLILLYQFKQIFMDPHLW